MLYDVGDILVCKKEINSECLEMSNRNFDMMPGDKIIITDTGGEPEDAKCRWYEMVPLNREVVLNVWNDEGHMVIDDNFEKLERPINPKEVFQELLEKNLPEAVEFVRKKIED